MPAKDNLSTKLTILFTPLAGRASMLLFVFFLFRGGLDLFRLGFSEISSLAWNAMLSLVFFIQHSYMIRKHFRIRLSGIIPAHFNDAVFTIFSSIVLTCVVLFWQPTETVLYTLQGFTRWSARGIFFLSIIGFGWGAWTLKSFDPFGVKPIRAHLAGKPLETHPFTLQGPYLWVRHPLYFFAIVMMWSCPDGSTDRLLFNVLWTAWIYVGTVFEEKDLLSDFGQQYRAYQRKVPMLIPWKGRTKT